MAVKTVRSAQQQFILHQQPVSVSLIPISVLRKTVFLFKILLYSPAIRIHRPGISATAVLPLLQARCTAMRSRELTPYNLLSRVAWAAGIPQHILFMFMKNPLFHSVSARLFNVSPGIVLHFKTTAAFPRAH